MDDFAYCSCQPIIEEMPLACPLVPWGSVRNSQKPTKISSQTWVSGTVSVTGMIAKVRVKFLYYSRLVGWFLLHDSEMDL